MEMDPERIKLLQEWAGYLLLPDTSEQKFLANEGEGKNGKSVFCAGITAMLGKDNCSFVPLEQFGDRFAKTVTIGRLVNICADVGELDKVAEGYLKSFTGGDTMYFDRKGISGIECNPTARMMINFNIRPRFTDRSIGIWRRMLLVPWEVEITEAEKVRGMDDHRWWEHSGEMPGILNWAVKGLFRLRKQRGFTSSEISTNSMNDYRDEMNPARRFLRENLEECKPYSLIAGITKVYLYDVYKYWMEKNGFLHPIPQPVFGKEVMRVFKNTKPVRGKENEEKKRLWYYEGINFSVEKIFEEKIEKGIVLKSTEPAF